ncbi:hypothetical protein C7T94_11980 [Pedobacter yulinensis]|uniref:HTH araC/xylS-type domain-containing protein n=1 Tax=Pedobacter yulinensis TaxID=2126353 RepID=A0A2T3HLI5_9SPHI|nr:helix-turn-helix domain-containing protein [Pedobacter yulinensis]PST83294.1 hypothetical protein C7T94_11980 [Pedobacter yulinensis]
MIFERFSPHPDLARIIECYWLMEDSDTGTRIEKIIPDGFPELIFHYGDPYENNQQGAWKHSSLQIVAGQLTSFFSIRNTGKTGMFAVKFKPTGLTQLYDLPMHRLTDVIADLSLPAYERLNVFQSGIPAGPTKEQLTSILDSHFLKISGRWQDNPVETAVALIFGQRGQISTAGLCAATGVTERQLQRLFRHYVGLSPKLYAQVIRFSHIWQLIREGKSTWQEITFVSGYYDQSHFIRNFKAFSGEDPGSYFFDTPSMANFFLNK